MRDWRALKHFCTDAGQYGLNIPADRYVDQGLRMIRTTDAVPGGGLTPAEDGVFVPPGALEPRYELEHGDLLLSRSGSLGRYVHYQKAMGSATFAGFLVRFRPQPDGSSSYLSYCFHSSFFQAAIEAEAVSSTIANFNAERYANVRLPWWDPIEQRVIADFLDTETARIDALIAKKQRLGRLVEQRFRDAVRRAMFELTREHGAVPLKRRVQCLDGRRVPVSSTERAQRPGPYPYYGASGVVDRIDDYIFDEELVLLGEDGAQLLDPEYKVAFVVRGKCWVNNHAHVLRPRGADATFLALHLATVDRMPFLSGATRPKLTQEDMGRIPLPNCDAETQREVGRRLVREETRTRELTERLRTQLTLLGEHRQALITAAVTGELAVPGVAA